MRKQIHKDWTVPKRTYLVKSQSKEQIIRCHVISKVPCPNTYDNSTPIITDLKLSEHTHGILMRKRQKGTSNRKGKCYLLLHSSKKNLFTVTHLSSLIQTRTGVDINYLWCVTV
jgi:hypothetical protein